MKGKNVFWGILLILIGTLFVLKNFDIIYFSWRDIFHLWPLVLILIGIAVLPVKTSVKVILSLVAIILTILIIKFSPVSSYTDSWFRWHGWEKSTDRHWTSQRFSEPYRTEIESASLDFEAVAGNFTIGGATEELFLFEKEGNIGPYESSIEIGDREVKVTIGLKGNIISGGNVTNTVDFSLSANPVWDLDLDVGAAKVDMDLSQYRVRNVNINGGAASIEVRFGKLYDNTFAKINTGAASIKIYVPEDVACEVDTDTFLSSKDLKGFNKVGKDTYVSENFADCEKNISIEIDSAISSFKVIRY